MHQTHNSKHVTDLFDNRTNHDIIKHRTCHMNPPFLTFIRFMALETT